MRLVSAVLGFLLRKLGLFLGVLLSLFLGFVLLSVLVPTLQKAEAQRHRLHEVSQERAALEADLEERQSSVVESLRKKVGAEVAATRTKVSAQHAAVRRLRRDRDEACIGIKKLVEQLPYVPNTCEAKRRLYDVAFTTQRRLQRNLDSAKDDARVLGDPDMTNEQKLERIRRGGATPSDEREIDTAQAELNQKKAEENELREAQGSWSGWIVTQWDRSWRWLAGIALLVIVMPGVLRTVSYFVLMPLVSRVQRPVRLAAGFPGASAVLHAGSAERTLTVRLPAGEVLSARSEHVRPVRGTIRGRLLYDWAAPFVSFAAGLYGLSRITGDEGGTEATLATPADPDSYLMRLDFEDHPGLVMRPRHVVGVIGAPTLETRWRWGIQAFATCQVRYIMFAGTGSLIVHGCGDVVATDPGGRSTRMEQNLVMGFDSRLDVGVRRTEVFWPYLWGKTALVDEEFTGRHPLFWQKSSAEGPKNPIARTFDVFFSALGKLLGF